MTEDHRHPRSPATQVGNALEQRLAAAAHVLLGDGAPAPGRTSAERAGSHLEALVGHVTTTLADDEVWLLLTATSGAFPDESGVLAGRRTLELAGTHPGEAVEWLLEVSHHAALNGGSPHLEMDVVVGEVLVDVDFCATHEHHTGIQRVVRELAPRWARERNVHLVAWTDARGAMRDLADDERDRVLRWYERQHDEDAGQAPQYRSGRTVPAGGGPQRLVVPWRSRVVLVENVEPSRCPSTAALARWSGNTVTALGYDCIPVTSPELVHPGLPDQFARYLVVVKHVDVVAAISASAAAEFQGFADMLPTQGLRGPRVVEVPLPVEVPSSARVDRSGDPLPTVLVVGSFEPRKNQLGVLVAAERLWREGLAFRLRFVGGGGYRTEFEALVARLQAQGRPVAVAVGIADAELWDAYREARFTVFVSMHEGYGLPVAESLACGVPAVTTRYGSTAEIAADGGALMVDPRDDEQLVDAMRRLVVDDDLVARLRREALARPQRGWDDYADELWGALVEPSR